ncbi:MAG: hypothetical protein HY905_12035 [Deltaproteobacteria bacterium]|nr:hypothetical protein [Deltaproteobacteria bacterium]
MRSWLMIAAALAAMAPGCSPDADDTTDGSRADDAGADDGGADADADAGADGGADGDTVPEADGEDVPCPGAPIDPGPTPCATLGIELDPYYAGSYSCWDLGAVPGVPPQKYGGLTLTQERCSTTLLIGGSANYPEGMLYAIEVARDPDGQIGAWVGTSTVYSEAAYNDGGVAFGPGGVLFLARWPENEMGQLAPGSTVTDKVIGLGAYDIASSPGGLDFVPEGYPTAGAMKLVSWPGGEWYTVELEPDGAGLYDVSPATHELTLPGGPEGFVYVAAGNPLFPNDSMLVSEWTANAVATYEIDDHGDPVPESRRDFITGLRGAEGAYRDPWTGDFFFSTWNGWSAGGDRVIVVRGFVPILL